MVLQSNVEQVNNPFRAKEVSEKSEINAQSFASSTDTSGLGEESDLVPLPVLSFREMTGFEEEFIEAHGNETNTARLVNEVLARCLVKPGEDPREALKTIRSLLTSDRDVALIRLRQKSLGDDISTEVSCPKCGEDNAVDFRLSNLPLEFNRPPKQLSVELSDGRIAVLRLPTAGDQEALFEADIEGESHYRSWLLARLLLKIGTEKGPFDLAFARSLPTSVRTKIEAKLNAIIPELDLSMGVTCHACEEVFSVPFDVPTFFLPSWQHERKT